MRYRLNAPGLGKELGCTLETPRDMYLGFYYAPGVVCEAIKTAIYAQCLLELVGKKPIPRYCEDHNDIVTCFDADTADASSASAAAFRPPAPWTAMPHRNPLRSRAIPMRSSCKRQLYSGQHHRALLRRPPA
mgnify:CR=1 FL=1